MNLSQGSVLMTSSRPSKSVYLPFLLDKYTNCKINPRYEKVLKLACIFYGLNKHRYVLVEDRTSIPRDMIFAIHWKEASGDFNTCLHNGDKLPGPTKRVPRGRGPFKNWEEAAVDALRFSNIAIFSSDWSIEKKLYACEAYNGWGYHNGAGINTTPPKTSPYLWAATDAYEKGLYVRDGVFDPDAISKNPGVAAIFKALQDLSI